MEQEREVGGKATREPTVMAGLSPRVEYSGPLRGSGFLPPPKAEDLLAWLAPITQGRPWGYEVLGQGEAWVQVQLEGLGRRYTLTAQMPPVVLDPGGALIGIVEHPEEGPVLAWAMPRPLAPVGPMTRETFTAILAGMVRDLLPHASGV